MNEFVQNLISTNVAVVANSPSNSFVPLVDFAAYSATWLLNFPPIENRLYKAHVREIEKYEAYLPKISDDDMEIVESLRDQGYFVTSITALGYPYNQPFQDEYIERVLRSLHDKAEEFYQEGKKERYIRPGGKFLKQFPQLFYIGLIRRLLNVGKHYFRLPVGYDGYSLRHSFGDGQRIGERIGHYDIEARPGAMLKVKFCLTDVDEKSGPLSIPAEPTFLSPGSRAFRYPKMSLEEEQRIKWKLFTGKAGTVIFFDPARVPHKQCVPIDGKTQTSVTYSFVASVPEELIPRHPWFRQIPQTEKDLKELMEPGKIPAWIEPEPDLEDIVFWYKRIPWLAKLVPRGYVELNA
jgi:hypothetical protein